MERMICTVGWLLVTTVGWWLVNIPGCDGGGGRNDVQVQISFLYFNFIFKNIFIYLQRSGNFERSFEILMLEKRDFLKCC